MSDWRPSVHTSDSCEYCGCRLGVVISLGKAAHKASWLSQPFQPQVFSSVLQPTCLLFSNHDHRSVTDIVQDSELVTTKSSSTQDEYKETCPIDTCA